LEETSLFARSIGETTDIVTKEMYTFQDKKGRSLTLRPEGTAPIARAYIEHSLHKVSPEAKLYYIGPMFRTERPQKGRSRQFHQIGVEVFGASPAFDAILVKGLSDMLKYFELKNFTIKLNSLGCNDDKDNFAKKLKKYLEKKKNRLCQDCKDRLKRNVLRTLDCKNETCIQVMKGAPAVPDSLCLQCKGAFEKLKTDLDKMKIAFKETKNLVRGLDYYTGTVFEIIHPALGAQDAIGAGGRYNNLVKDLGGPDVPAIGYALGIERMIMALKKDLASPEAIPVVYIATLGDRAIIKGTQICEQIKEKLLEKIIVFTDVRGASLKAQMRAADKNNARLVVILGEDELDKGEVLIRNMVTKQQALISIDDIMKEVRKQLGLCSTA
jgi:histidyl-tRNA synthetase